MKTSVMTAGALGLLLVPVRASAAEPAIIDFSTLALFLLINFVITAAFFAIGIVIIGICSDGSKPWYKALKTRKSYRKPTQKPTPAPYRQRRRIDILQEERQDVI